MDHKKYKIYVKDGSSWRLLAVAPEDKFREIHRRIGGNKNYRWEEVEE